jgi:hypothetical protein
VVVVGTDARDLQLRILDLHEGVVREGQQVRVERLAVDSVLVHPLNPRLCVKRPGVGVVDGRRVLRRKVVPSSHRPVRHTGQLAAADHPTIAAEALVEFDVRDIVAPLGHGQSRRPEVRHLGEVAVCVEDRDGREHGRYLESLWAAILD